MHGRPAPLIRQVRVRAVAEHPERRFDLPPADQLIEQRLGLVDGLVEMGTLRDRELSPVVPAIPEERGERGGRVYLMSEQQFEQVALAGPDGEIRRVDIVIPAAGGGASICSGFEQQLGYGESLRRVEPGSGGALQGSESAFIAGVRKIRVLREGPADGP